MFVYPCFYSYNPSFIPTFSCLKSYAFKSTKAHTDFQIFMLSYFQTKSCVLEILRFYPSVQTGVLLLPCSRFYISE